MQRKYTLDLLVSLGITCDDVRNKINGKESGGIIAENNKFPIAMVVPTNEELVIARETLKLLY